MMTIHYAGSRSTLLRYAHEMPLASLRSMGQDTTCSANVEASTPSNDSNHADAAMTAFGAVIYSLLDTHTAVRRRWLSIALIKQLTVDPYNRSPNTNIWSGRVVRRDAHTIYRRPVITPSVRSRGDSDMATSHLPGNYLQCTDIGRNAWL